MRVYSVCTMYMYSCIAQESSSCDIHQLNECSILSLGCVLLLLLKQYLKQSYNLSDKYVLLYRLF